MQSARQATAPSMRRWTWKRAFCLGVPIFDVLFIITSAILAKYVHAWFRPDIASFVYSTLPLGITGSVGLLLGFNILRGYDFNRLRSLRRSVPWAVGIWLMCLAVMMALAYLLGLHQLYPRSLTLPWAAVVMGGLIGIRVLGVAGIRIGTRRGLFLRRVAVIGANAYILRLLKDDPDFSVVGIFDDRMSRVPEQVEGYPVLGTVPDLVRFCRENLLDVIFLTLPWAARERNAAIVHQLRELPVDISMVPEMDVSLLPPRGRMLWLGRIPTILVNRPPLSEVQLIEKWLLDKTFAILALIATSPVMLAAAVAVAVTSPGPVFFVQDRFGFNGQRIRVLKFRSMYQDQQDQSGRQRTTRDDPRVTPVGRILRRYSIDELPQFLNVLKGQMSVVGPRAQAVSMTVAGREYHDAVAEYHARHKVKPGLTGWAQVNGARGEVETMEQAEERIRLDLYYVDHWSLMLDLRIIARTILLVLYDPQAY